MGQFSYSFAVSMMHSVWQSAILLALYFAIVTALRNPHPAFKRNLLFGAVAAQLICTLATILFYYNGSFAVLQNSLNNILPEGIRTQQWLQVYAPWIFYIYTLVVIFRFSFQLRNWLNFKRGYAFTLVKPSADIKMFTQSKAHHFGISKKIAVWYSNSIHTPIVFGFLKPVILLPVALVNQLSISETESLIVHELTHIKYNDYLLNWLLMAGETIYFFNPFLRIMAAKIKLEREKNCDVQVLQFNYCPIGYADALLKTARARQRVPSFQLAAVMNQSQLLTRIRFFSANKKLSMRNTNTWPFSLAGLLLLIAFTFSLLGSPAKKIITGDVFKTVAVNNETHVLPAVEPVALTEVKTNNPLKTGSIKTQKITDTKLLSDDAIASSITKDIPTSEIHEIKVIPVSYNTVPVVTNEGKDVIINEESSSGKMLTRAYRIKLKDGVWVTEPLWVISETKAKDSLQKKIADTVWQVKMVPVAQ